MNEDFLKSLSKSVGALVGIFFAFLFIVFILKDASAEEEFKNTVVSSPFVLDEVYVCELTTDRKYMVMRDSVTDVLYLQYRDYRKGGLTIMLNPTTGLPLTYTDYLAFSAEE